MIMVLIEVNSSKGLKKCLKIIKKTPLVGSTVTELPFDILIRPVCSDVQG